MKRRWGRKRFARRGDRLGRDRSKKPFLNLEIVKPCEKRLKCWIYLALVNLTLQGSAMVRLVALLSICLLSRETAVAQGTYVFTWHGDSNFFHATFQVTEAEMQPGVPLGSSLFFNSVSLTNPAGATYNYQAPQDAVVGGLNPWAFGITLLDLTRGTELLISGAEPPIGAMTGLIHEKPFSGGDLWYETGRWTDAYVPEPSIPMLLGMGLAVYLLGTRRRV